MQRVGVGAESDAPVAAFSSGVTRAPMVDRQHRLLEPRPAALLVLLVCPALIATGAHR